MVRKYLIAAELFGQNKSTLGLGIWVSCHT